MGQTMPDTTPEHLPERGNTMSAIRDGLHSAFCVTAKFCGPTDTRGAYIAYSWEGYPSDGPRKVRVKMPATSDGGAVAITAQTVFLAWLNKSEGAEPRYFWEPVRATYASAGPDSWVVLVEPDMKPICQKKGA